MTAGSRNPLRCCFIRPRYLLGSRLRHLKVLPCFRYGRLAIEGEEPLRIIHFNDFARRYADVLGRYALASDTDVNAVEIERCLIQPDIGDALL